MNLPEKVKMVEVGARDGLQNQPGQVPPEIKVALIERLAASGFPVIDSSVAVPTPGALPATSPAKM